MPNKLKNPLNYMGGKFYLANWIIDNMPEYDVYVEPFGGAGHVILKKEQKGLEVYNDVNEHLINLFKVLQNKDKAKELLWLLYLTPHHRQFFNDLRDGNYSPECSSEDIFKAYHTLVMMKQCFAGNWMNMKPTWGFAKNIDISKHSKRFSSFPDSLIPLIERLKSIQIESLDFKDCIKKYDSEKTFFYCDPPYYDREFYYKGSFSKEDHIELSDLLNSIKGKAAISYYMFDELEDLYPHDKWRYERKDTFLRSKKPLKDGTRQKSEELLIMNYGENHGQ